MVVYYKDNRSNSRANTCTKDPFGFAFIRFPTNLLCSSVNHSNLADQLFRVDASFKFLPYQLSKVVYWTTLALTGNGELGFDSGEGA